MKTSANYLLWWMLWFLESDAVPNIAKNRRKAVHGLSLSITCTSDVAITGGVYFRKDGVSRGGCSVAINVCGTGVSRYTVTQNRPQRTTTLTIDSVVSSKDNGTWTCIQDGGQPSAELDMSQFATILDWNMTNYSPAISSLPSSVTPEDNITVTVITPCSAPSAVITWAFPRGVIGSPPSSTSSSPGSCPLGQVQTTNTLTLRGNTASLYSRQMALTVRVEHDSFDPPTYIKSQISNLIQFPVPVTKVTLANISTDNQKVGQHAGESLTLNCVTSLCFPTSTITWSGLPVGTNPRVTEETTSGVFVKTTSTVSFIVSKTIDGNIIRCVASNINGQSSQQSNRAILDVWYPPNKPTMTTPGSLCEGKSTSLTCSSADPGNPPVTYYWTKNNVSMATGSPYTFTPERDDHQAQIRCEAGNDYTDRSGHSRPQSDVRQLNVYYSPQITIIPPATQNKLEGQTLSLTCSADSNPDNAVLSWTFNGTSIPGPRLEKMKLNLSDQGVYTCTGRVNTSSVCPGGFLQGDSQVEVNVYAALPVPGDLIAWSTSPDTIKLSWKVVVRDGLKQQFIVEYKEEGGTWERSTESYNETRDNYVQGYVRGLKALTLYFLRVKSVTSIGNSDYTGQVRALTLRSTLTMESINSQESSTGTTLIGVGIALIVVTITVAILQIVLFLKQKRSLETAKANQEQYASFQSREGNTYDELRGTTYQNTEFNSGE